MRKLAGVFLLLLILQFSACIHTRVSSIEPQNIDEICIKRNPKMLKQRILPQIRGEIHKHGIQTRVCEDDQFKGCPYILEYTANWEWDLGTYLAYVKLDLYKNGQVIGYAEYDGTNAGLALNKYKTDQSKISFLVSRLLKNIK